MLRGGGRRTRLSWYPSYLTQFCTGLLTLWNANKNVRIMVTMQDWGRTANSFRLHQSPHCMAECYTKVTRGRASAYNILTQIGSDEKLERKKIRRLRDMLIPGELTGIRH